jgi:hypothetical protein
VRGRGWLVGKGFLGLALLSAGLLAPSASASSCGGLLQPSCPPPQLYPNAADPGGDANADVPVPPPPGKLFGFNTNLWWQTSGGEDLVPFEVDTSAAAGAQVLRTTVSWAAFATSADQPLGDQAGAPRGQVQGAGGLKQLDELYDRAASAGIQLDIVINNAPKWASAYADCTPFLGFYSSRCEPVADNRRLYPTSAHLTDLSNFVTALGERYPGVVFETWNEPNLDQGPQRPSSGGAFLGQMQCAVWRAAKALAQPSQVLSPAFGDFYSENATRSYMRAFYSTGNACFDDLSVHTYNGDSHNFGAGSPLAGHMKIYRDARAEAGDTRPMWVTEFGFSTARAKGAVSEADQAALVRTEYDKLLTMPDVAAAIVHTLRDSSGSSGDIEIGYGWTRRDDSPKPVFCLFAGIKQGGQAAGC